MSAVRPWGIAVKVLGVKVWAGPAMGAYAFGRRDDAAAFIEANWPQFDDAWKARNSHRARSAQALLRASSATG